MNVPQIQSHSAGTRRAWAQPRFLLGAAALALMGATWAAFANPTFNVTKAKAGVAMPHMASTKSKPASLSDLPAMVARYGEARRLKSISSGLASGGRITNNVGTGNAGFNLVETDLTSGASASDERDPASSPSGDFIAFTSTGADSNNDGKIDSLSTGGFRHIWIMNRDGSGQRQLTGLNAFDAGRNQDRPTWSPDGNQIAYSDQDTDGNGGNVGGSQLWIVSTVDTNPTPTQRTFFAPDFYNIAARATVNAPAWSPNGLSIAFVTNYDGRFNTILPSRDIFTIAPSGSTITLTRVTGETDASNGNTDPIGNTTDDENPAWATSNTSVLFFSSNRDINGKLVDDPNTTPNEANGRRIWRIFSDGTGAGQVTDPTTRPNGQANDQDDFPTVSLTADPVGESVGFQTNTYLDNTDQADGAAGRDLNVWRFTVNSGSYSSSDAPTSAEEDGSANGAEVLTNILSSPANFAASRLTAPQTVDRAADREPSFSRNTATAQALSQLIFASGRTYAPSTSSNTTPTATAVPTSTPAPLNVATATPVPTATTASTPLPVNTGGGDQLDSSGNDAGATHDIWITSTTDLTPPALVPQAVGNLQSPVVAPQQDAPFFAPRTPEFGLKPDLIPTASEQAEILDSSTTNTNTYAKRGGLRFAVVLRDTESGLRENTANTASTSVRVSFFNADANTSIAINPSPTPAFIRQNENNVYVNAFIEQKATIARINGSTSFALNAYDDGPVSNGGHEQEAGAIAGDGNFYCEGLLPTPSAGDYYIDVTARDRAGNGFTYDNIWGISTRRFTRQTSGTSDLFVSDYTCGQIFPYTLAKDARFYNMVPCETYYLTSTATTGFDGQDPTTANVYGNALPYAFLAGNVDIWRILCRGAVPPDVLNSYRPTIVKQIDPNVPNPTAVPIATPSTTATPVPGAAATATPAPTATATAGPTPTATATPLPYSKLTRNVAVANQSIIWAAPFTGTAFVGPGSLIDATTQANLTSFMQDGGRLFVSGRDVAWGLSSAGTTNNSFLSNELATNYGGEVDTITPDNKITAVNQQGLLYIDRFLDSGPRFDYYDDYLNLEFGFRFEPGPNPPTYLDGAITMNPYINFSPPGNPNSEFGLPDPSSNPDIIVPTPPSNTTLTSDYSYKGQLIAQRILHKQRNNGLQSRAVFFSFGFEALNRRWRVPTPSDGRACLNQRAALAEFILRYFKTTGVSGQVINNATNLPIPNFLISVDEFSFTTGVYVDTFYARTDANGNYSVLGLPNDVYRISAYTTNTNPPLTSPQGYFAGTPLNVRIFGGSPVATGLNLRVIPTIPGSVVGRAVTSNGTFANRSDDSPLANLPVLIRSVGVSPAFVPTGTGRFSRLTTTNATGDFTFSNVPALAEMEVIFNPNPEDIPAGSNISYTGPNPNFGRRVLPDTTRPLNSIIVPSGDIFYLNDVGTVTVNGTPFTVTADNTNPDTAADQRVPIIVPRGPTITGLVRINGAASSGATLQLFTANSDGSATSTQVAGSPVQYSSGTSTTTDGKFAFIDVPAKTQTNGGTQYVIRATITRDNAILVRDVPITLYQGKDLAQNVDFTLAKITGRVLQSGTPVANATVTLQNADGTTFVPTRTVQTNASGTYTIVNVPVAGYTPGTITGSARTFTYTNSGGVINYRVFATSNALTGSTTVAVRATDTSVTASDITLQNQQLTGKVQLQIDNNAITNLGGATVELLNSSGASFSPARTTTSSSDGSYGFTITVAGTYRIRSTYKGDTVTSDPFTAPAGPSTGPTVINRQRTISGVVTDGTSNNAVVVGATLTLKSSNGTVLATATSVAGGRYQFAAVAPGTNFTITATKASLGGSATLATLSRGAFPSATVNVSLKKQVAVTQNPTTFTKGMTYSVSFPYETSSNATTRNVYDRTSSNTLIPVADAFNYPPTAVVNGKTVRYYTISRFNPTNLTYQSLEDNANLIRGQGYLVQVAATPADGTKLRLQMPADNAALKPLNSGTIDKFTISLVWNSSLSGNSLNGRNFIGFGFDPAKYGAVAWDTTNTITDPAKASVQVIDGTKKYTLKQAVDANIIYPSLTTTDPSNGRTVTSTTLAAFGGYFVTVRKDGVKLLFQFPQSTN